MKISVMKENLIEGNLENEFYVNLVLGVFIELGSILKTQVA